MGLPISLEVLLPHLAKGALRVEVIDLTSHEFGETTVAEFTTHLTKLELCIGENHHGYGHFHEVADPSGVLAGPVLGRHGPIPRDNDRWMRF